MAESYVTISLLSLSILELLVLQILHVSTLDLSDAPALPQHKPAASTLPCPLTLGGSNAAKPSGR